VRPLRSVVLEFFSQELLFTLRAGMDERLDELAAQRSRSRPRAGRSEQRRTSTEEFQAFVVYMLHAALNNWKSDQPDRLQELVGNRLGKGRLKVLKGAFGHAVDYKKLAAVLSAQWSSFVLPPSTVAIDESLWSYQGAPDRCAHHSPEDPPQGPAGLLRGFILSSFIETLDSLHRVPPS